MSSSSSSLYSGVGERCPLLLFVVVWSDEFMLAAASGTKDTKVLSDSSHPLHPISSRKSQPGPEPGLVLPSVYSFNHES